MKEIFGRGSDVGGTADTIKMESADIGPANSGIVQISARIRVDQVAAMKRHIFEHCGETENNQSAIIRAALDMYLDRNNG
jgi:hypothetical protein